MDTAQHPLGRLPLLGMQPSRSRLGDEAGPKTSLAEMETDDARQVYDGAVSWILPARVDTISALSLEWPTAAPWHSPMPILV